MLTLLIILAILAMPSHSKELKKYDQVQEKKEKERLKAFELEQKQELQNILLKIKILKEWQALNSQKLEKIQNEPLKRPLKASEFEGGKIPTCDDFINSPLAKQF